MAQLPRSGYGNEAVTAVAKTSDRYLGLAKKAERRVVPDGRDWSTKDTRLEHGLEVLCVRELDAEDNAKPARLRGADLMVWVEAVRAQLFCNSPCVIGMRKQFSGQRWPWHPLILSATAVVTVDRVYSPSERPTISFMISLAPP